MRIELQYLSKRCGRSVNMSTSRTLVPPQQRPPGGRNCQATWRAGEHLAGSGEGRGRGEHEWRGARCAGIAGVPVGAQAECRRPPGDRRRSCSAAPGGDRAPTAVGDSEVDHRQANHGCRAGDHARPGNHRGGLSSSQRACRRRDLVAQESRAGCSSYPRQRVSAILGILAGLASAEHSPHCTELPETADSGV